MKTNLNTNRRAFFQKASLAAGFLAVLGPAFKAHAQTAPTAGSSSQLVLTAVISNNHGHQVNLAGIDIVTLLRKTRATGPVAVDIRGVASHTHTITLTEALLVQLLEDGTIAVTSSLTAGHTHGITLNLDVTATPQLEE